MYFYSNNLNAVLFTLIMKMKDAFPMSTVNRITLQSCCSLFIIIIFIFFAKVVGR